MVVFHGFVEGAQGQTECIGVRFSQRDLSEPDARRIGGLLWRTGEVVDRVTSVNGTNSPMPNQKGWFVRAVIGSATDAETGSVLATLGALGTVREYKGAITLDDLDKVAGDPAQVERLGAEYDGRDYLGPSRFVLRAWADESVGLAA